MTHSRFTSAFLVLLVTLLIIAVSFVNAISKANLREENRIIRTTTRHTIFAVNARTGEANIPLNDDDIYTVPANSDESLLDFKLGVPDLDTASTGRYLVIGAPQKRFHVYGPSVKDRKICDGGNRSFVSDQAKSNGCIYATNLSPFSYAKDAKCEGPMVSDGSIIVPGASSYAACVGVTKAPQNDLVFGISSKIVSMLPRLQQLTCGFDWLVIDGKPTASSSTLIAPRTALGVDKSGNLISFVAEGSEVAKTGLTLNQTATWLADLGLVYAVNFDGGGSSTSWLAKNGGVQGCPTGRDIPCCDERQVASTSCVI